MNEQLVMPAFVFVRYRDIELEGGFVLAGRLFVDIPARSKPKKRDWRMVQTTIRELATRARSGSMPQDAIIVGWPGGEKPPNAVDTRNNEIMAAWAEKSTVFAVRVDPHNDGLVRFDSDLLASLGLPNTSTVLSVPIASTGATSITGTGTTGSTGGSKRRTGMKNEDHDYERVRAMRLTPDGRRAARAGEFPPSMPDIDRLSDALAAMLPENCLIRWDDLFMVRATIAADYGFDYRATLAAVRAGRVTLRQEPLGEADLRDGFHPELHTRCTFESEAGANCRVIVATTAAADTVQ
jgi:hypothetical protein